MIAAKRVSDLVPGDVIVLGDEPVEVMQEPFLGGRGVSVFDEFELFLRARVRRLSGRAEVGFATWDLDACVFTADRDRPGPA
jgi:hypothetical protein